MKLSFRQRENPSVNWRHTDRSARSKSAYTVKENAGVQGVFMNLKAKITQELSKATCDKTELNKTVLKWKKHFDEAGKVIAADKKKKK